MNRVVADEDWTLMCPNQCKGLADCYGEEFEKLYTKYEREGKGKKTVKARYIWNEIIQAQIETGTPFIVYKDAVNSKSNQKHIGTIRSSNLCTEILEYSSPDEIAVCNLVSICLPMFVTDAVFDFKKLIEITRIVTRNMNRVIDANYYPVKEAEKSNMRHRPIGIGVQGLADMFVKMRIAYEDDEAITLNEKIFATIYYAAVTESIALAKKNGPYESYEGSPASKGLL